MQALYNFILPREGAPWQLWELTPGAEPPKPKEVDENAWIAQHDHMRSVCEALGTVVKRGEDRIA